MNDRLATPCATTTRSAASLRLRIAATSALAASLFAAPAEADSYVAGAGLFFGYAFGEHPGFNWGVEGFYTQRFEQKLCSAEPRAGFGPMAQIAFVDLRGPRFTLAAHGGSELVRHNSALTAELGLSYRVNDDPGFGIHVGLLPQLSVWNAYARAQLLQSEFAIGGGGRFAPTYGLAGITCVEGRPLRVRDGYARLPRAVSLRGDERGLRALRLHETPRNVARSSRLNAAERSALAGLWSRDAQTECASVPAFIELAEQLLAVGAPTQLVERALSAAEDEIRHAMTCAELATQHAGTPVLPQLPAGTQAERRVPLDGEPGLLRLAVESWLDGCLGEGAAAARARVAAVGAKDRATRQALERIAEDENQHAQLSWDILQWVLSQIPQQAQHALQHTPQSSASVPPHHAPSGLAEQGRLSAADVNALYAEHSSRAGQRLTRLLAAH